MTQQDRLFSIHDIEAGILGSDLKNFGSKPDGLLMQVARQLLDTMRENERLSMRLAQIASGDYKACGLFAEDVARDALSNKESGDE